MKQDFPRVGFASSGIQGSDIFHECIRAKMASLFPLELSKFPAIGSPSATFFPSLWVLAGISSLFSHYFFF